MAKFNEAIITIKRVKQVSLKAGVVGEVCRAEREWANYTPFDRAHTLAHEQAKKGITTEKLWPMPNEANAQYDAVWSRADGA